MSHPYMTSSQHDKQKKDLHVDLVLDWLNRAMIEKDKKKNEDVTTLSWGTIQQLHKTTWLLGIFQVVLIILFATVAGSEVICLHRTIPIRPNAVCRSMALIEISKS
jgi:hypothetical protein